jgi:hypothetical protein
MRRSAFQRHARVVVEYELRRAGRPLGALPAEGRRSVEDVSSRVASALVDALLADAGQEPALAEALASIYGRDGAREPRAA